MGKKVNPVLNAVLVTQLILSVFTANGQISTPCTSSMISSYTPCLNYITGSSSRGSSPTADCCNSLKSLMTDSVDCGCLIITGNVPLSIPFTRTLAISLPRVCNSGVPIQCKASGVPLPAPGPVLLGPTQAPLGSSPLASSPLSPRASKASLAAPPPIETTQELAPASPPVASLGPVANPGIRPVLTPSSISASNPSYVSAPYLLLIFSGIMVFKSY